MPRRCAGRCWRAMPGTPAACICSASSPCSAACSTRPWRISARPPRRAPTSPSVITAWARRWPRPSVRTLRRPRSNGRWRCKPDFAEAHKDLGVMLMAQGRFKEASAHFARALELVPQLAENFGDTVSTLLRVNPALGEGVARAAAAWPKLASADELLGAAGWAAIADDPMLLGVLTTTPVRDLALERFLTSVRAAVLERAARARPMRIRACWVLLCAGAPVLQQRIRFRGRAGRARSGGTAEQGADRRS